MTSSEIRNKLVEMKTLYKQSQTLLQESISETKELFGTISESDRQRLIEQGFDLSVLDYPLDTITSQEQVNEFTTKLRTSINQLHSYLENSLANW